MMVRKQPKDSRKCIMEKHKYVGTLKAYQQKCTSSMRSQRTFSVGSHCRSHFFDRSIQSKRAHTRYNLKCVFMGILCWFVETVYIVVAVAVVVVSSACDCYNSNVVIAFCFVRFRSYFTLCRIDSFFSILCFLLLLRH